MSVIFTHLKLRVVLVRHNFKLVKKNIYCRGLKVNITDDIGVFSIIKAWMFDLYIMRSDFFTSTYNNKKVCKVDLQFKKTIYCKMWSFSVFVHTIRKMIFHILISGNSKKLSQYTCSNVDCYFLKTATEQDLYFYVLAVNNLKYI